MTKQFKVTSSVLESEPSSSTRDKLSIYFEKEGNDLEVTVIFSVQGQKIKFKVEPSNYTSSFVTYFEKLFKDINSFENITSISIKKSFFGNLFATIKNNSNSANIDSFLKQLSDKFKAGSTVSV